MKPCKTCGHTTRRGWCDSAPDTHSIYCLICQTARIMATFAMPKKGK